MSQRRTFPALEAAACEADVVQIKATEATTEDIIRIFGLQESSELKLAEAKYDVPEHLVRWLAGVHEQHLETATGCHWPIETIIRAAQIKFDGLAEEASSSAKAEAPPHDLDLYHQVDLKAEVYDLAKARKWVVTGTADWVISRDMDRARAAVDGYVLLAFMANSITIGAARAQLLISLACIRQARIQAGKGNYTVHGMYSNGDFYQFMCLREDGQWLESIILFRRWPHHLKKIYNFLVSIMWAGARSSISTSPIEPAEVQRREIEPPHSQKWVKFVVGEGEEPDDATEAGGESDSECGRL